MSASILFLCTGNATRSVIAGAVLRSHLPDVEVQTAGTFAIDGLPMSWRTRAGFDAVGVVAPRHLSRQAVAEDLERATVVIGLAPEHVEWVRREHPSAAARTVTLQRLNRALADDERPLADRVAELDLAAVELAPWEEVVDPGGGEVEAFIACANEVVGLVEQVAGRLRPRSPSGETWSGARAVRWVAIAAALDRQLAPVSDALFEMAGLQPGERVLDVGCGAGPTTRRAAEQVGSTGSVVGLDIAAPMLEAARAEPVPAGAAPIEWVQADVGAWDPPADRFDAVISRFGVMFFDDPGAAFATLRRATAPGGRLCVAVWGMRDESAVFEVPLQSVLTALGQPDHPAVPARDFGPSSLGDPQHVVDLLSAAGWRDVRWNRRHLELPLGGGVGPADAASVAIQLGAARAVVDTLDDTERERALVALAEALAAHVDTDGHVRLSATIGIVTATPPT